MEDLTSPAPPAPHLDEWLENRERHLGGERNRLGRLFGDALRGLAGRLSASRRRQAAEASLELVETLGRLSEVREVRRGLLGLGPGALIRTRDTPTFVRDNPDYARTVADEISPEGLGPG